MNKFKVKQSECAGYHYLMIKQACKKTKQLVTGLDLFSNSQLLRYRQDTEYRSANGGLCSFAIKIFFLIIFTNSLLKTINRSIITSTTTLYQEADPSIFTTKSSGFMFAIGIADFDLANPIIKYFDIKIVQSVSTNINGTKFNNATYLNLSPCSRQVWTSVYPNIGDTFDRQKLKKWLCLDPNDTISIQGKFTSDIFQYLKITVKSCTNDSNRTCVDQSIIDQKIKDFGGSLPFNYYFMNTVINANNQEYLGNYLEDRNYFTFNKNSGFLANLFVSVYNIQTDVSLLPTTDIVEDTGGIVYESTQNLVQDVNVGNPNYIQFFIRKSSLKLSIKRSFQSYFKCISYVGGLFSAIISMFSFMSAYNQSAFQIDITSNIFKSSKKQKINSNNFNLITYFAYGLYSKIRFFGFNPEWKLFKQFDSIYQQISKQLNIKLILKKIGFLQDCMEYLFEDYQLKCLHLKDKLTLEQAAKIRKQFCSRPLLLKLKKKRHKQDQGGKQLQNKNDFDNMPEPPLTEKVLQHRKVYELQAPYQMRDIKSISKGSHQRQGGSSIVFKRSMQKDKYAQDHGQKINKNRYGSDNDREDMQSSEGQLSSMDDSDEKEFYEDTLNCIHQLKEEASQGKYRCLKIFKNLDQTIKNVAGIPSTEHIREEINLQKKIKRKRSLDLIKKTKGLQ